MTGSPTLEQFRARGQGTGVAFDARTFIETNAVVEFMLDPDG